LAAENYHATVQQLYVAYFGRPADVIGLDYYARLLDSRNGDANALLHDFASSRESSLLYSQGSAELKIEAMYQTMFGRPADAEGLAYWARQVESGTVILSQAAYVIAFNAQAADKARFAAKTAAAIEFTKAIDTTPELLAYERVVEYGRSWLAPVISDASAAIAVAGINGVIAEMIARPEIKFLTHLADHLEGSIFEARLIYNPAWDDRMPSLQSEDVLTGTGSWNELTAVLYETYDWETNSGFTVKPTLINIHAINLQVHADSDAVDLQRASGVQKISIDGISAYARPLFGIANIMQVTNDLTVQNAMDGQKNVYFRYADGVLGNVSATGGAESLDLTLSQASLGHLYVGGNNGNDGFEKVKLQISNDVFVKKLEINDLEDLAIGGSGSLSLLSTEIQTTDLRLSRTVLSGNGGVHAGNGTGIRTIDASAFSGTMEIDISNAVKRKSSVTGDTILYPTITGGSGNDTFWVDGNISAASATQLTSIDGGAGTNTLRTYASILPGGGIDPRLTNIQFLEMRAGGTIADLSAFDAALQQLIVRDENMGGEITLNSVSATLAANGGITFLRPFTYAHGQNTLSIRLAEGSGKDDHVSLVVKGDLSNSSEFNYRLNIDVDNAIQSVEHITIVDADYASNIVFLGNAVEHTKSLVLSGGGVGNSFSIADTVHSTVVDASLQKSNVQLTVGSNASAASGIGHTITLGLGVDTLVVAGAADVITGGAGPDRIYIAESVAAQDILKIADGDSVLSGRDIVTGFGAAGAATDDVLDLGTITVAVDTALFDGANVNAPGTMTLAVAEHAISKGVVTFGNSDAAPGLQAVVVSSIVDTGRVSLISAIDYLAANVASIGAGSTVAFAYDANGDGKTDSTIVFQDGVRDTVVELVGVIGTSVGGFLNAQAAAGTDVTDMIKII
jgi:hypothetical protein